ncbi:MAG: hypothetical protein PHF63_08720 [Herbinix sp.]|nr:hypothetical protein [Herbinix sp.]
MLAGVFRTKERKVIIVSMVIVIMMIGIFIMIDYSDNKRFKEQAVMAENYLEAGNYEQAVEAFQKAMSMKDSNQQLLTIGLSDAYVGMDEYDMALEVLRSCYEKTSGNKIKKKIEEVTSKKTEYEYLQAASRAEVYFSNKEYDKAIAEYEKAKLIKSKEVKSYKRIAQAYMEKGEYDLAQEEILEGQELTQDESLKELLIIVDNYLNKKQYELLINEASEYINQENYNDGIAKYEEAIAFLPKESTAYIGLAETYIIQKEYNKAYLFLQTTIKLVESKKLEDLLNKVSVLKEASHISIK